MWTWHLSVSLQEQPWAPPTSEEDLPYPDVYSDLYFSSGSKFPKFGDKEKRDWRSNMEPEMNWEVLARFLLSSACLPCHYMTCMEGVMGETEDILGP